MCTTPYRVPPGTCTTHTQGPSKYMHRTHRVPPGICTTHTGFRQVVHAPHTHRVQPDIYIICTTHTGFRQVYAPHTQRSVRYMQLTIGSRHVYAPHHRVPPGICECAGIACSEVDLWGVLTPVSRCTNHLLVSHYTCSARLETLFHRLYYGY